MLRAPVISFFHPARSYRPVSPREVEHAAGEVGRPLAVDFVSGAELDFVELAEHVEQHDGDAVGPGDPRAVPAATASNQPQRRGRPVTVPNSRPTWRMCSPVGLSSSVGNGPPPTRVV